MSSEELLRTVKGMKFRPLGEFFNVGAVKVPSGLPDVQDRVQQNVHYFQGNYAVIVLLNLCWLLSYALHDYSFIFFVLCAVGAGYYLFKLRNGVPLTIAGTTLTEQQVLIAYGAIVAIWGFFGTYMGMPFIYNLASSGFVILTHAALLEPRLGERASNAASNVAGKFQ